MTEPTEAEVSAAASAMCKYMTSHEGDDEPVVITVLKVAHAALTAAAQVRERAEPVRQMGGYTQTIDREGVSRTVYGKPKGEE